MLRRIGIGVVGSLAILLLVVVVVLAVGIPIDLSGFRGKLASAATEALGRDVAIDGPIRLIPGFGAVAEIEGVRVGNPPDWPDSDFARLGSARIGIRLLPLLDGELRIDEIVVDGLVLNLETNAAGESNWVLGLAAEETSATPEPPADEGSSAGFRFVELDSLSLTGIAITRDSPEHREPLTLIFDEITGAADEAEPMSLAIKGTLQGAPYEAHVDSGSLVEMTAPTRPWPIAMNARIIGAELTLDGTVAEPLRGRGLDVGFDFSGPVLKELEEILETTLPDIRSFHFAGRISESGNRYQVSELEGDVAATGFNGHFEADLSGNRPRFSGSVDVATVDIGPLREVIPDSETEIEDSGAAEIPGVDDAPSADAERELNLDDPILTLAVLSLFDAEFQLDIGEVVNSELGIRDASLQVRVSDGALSAPMAVTVADVPFGGRVELEREDSVPQLRLSLDAAQSDIGTLADVFVKGGGVEGRFDSAHLGLSAQGETLRSLLTTAELDFSLSGSSLSYGHDTRGNPVEFTLSEATMVFPAASESRVSAQGTLLGEPFSMAFNGGTFLDNFVARSWPIEFSASGGGADLGIAGTVRRVQGDSGTEIDFSIQGDHIGGLAPWLGFSPDADQAYALNGSVTTSESGLLIGVQQARIGNSAFTGTVGLERQGDTDVTVAELRFTDLDLEGLGVMFAGRDVKEVEEIDKEVLTIDVPILPAGIEIFDSDLDISIDRVRMQPTNVSQVAFKAKIRDGYMAEAPVGLTVGGARFDGSFSLDLREEIPKVGAKVNSSKVDVGRLLEELNMVRDLSLRADRFELDLALEGASPRQILQRSELSIAVNRGLWQIYPPGMEKSVDVRVRDGLLTAKRDEPITLTLKGAIDETPVDIALGTHALAEFAEPRDKVRTRLDLAVAKARLALTGTAPTPLDIANLHFNMDLQGEKLSDFDELFEVSLPPVGPYRAKGQFGTRSSGYYIDDLVLSVGESTLTGALDFQTTRVPPRLDVDLVAQSIQLDDFEVGDWSPTGEGEEGEEGETAEGEQDDQDAEEDRRFRAFLTPEVMRSFESRVALDVEEVLSGSDPLGQGTMVLTIEDGRLTAEPLTLDVPGGAVDMRLSVEPTETDVKMQVSAQVERFDYGILARRIDPESDAGGEISVDVDIDTRGPDLDKVMVGSNGHMKFGVWPKDLNAGIFDLWAVNLFIAIMPSLDSSEASKVNCIVGNFQIDDGIMRPKAVLVDSTRIQASADGVIDFKEETIEFKAAPRAKRPQMFSAQTPVQITGKFSDFEVGLPAGAAFGTGFRIITSPVVVPFQWVLAERPAADGKGACERAWTWDEPESERGEGSAQ